MKLGNHRFKGDKLNIIDKLQNKECLLFRCGELDITVNKKGRLGYLLVQRRLTGHDRLRCHQAQYFVIQR